MAHVFDDQFTEGKTVHKDSRGRIAIGSAATADQYRVSRNAHGQILLTPIVEVPEHETWLWRNTAVLESLKRGSEDAAAGRVHDVGSFAEYAENSEE